MAKEILCGFGVDVDAVAGWLGSYGGEDSPDDISRGLFAGEVGTRFEPPAWINTGCPCGDGTTLSGPFTLKNRPTWLMGRTLAGSATTPFSLSQTKASASTLDHSALQTAMNSSIRS